MFPACVYAGQIIAVFAIVIVAIWGATHWRPRRWAIRQRSVLPGSRSRATQQTKLVSAMARPWANVKEIVAAHLYKPKGIFLGVPRGDAYLRHDGPDHVMRVAPTRSGKGLVSPTVPARTSSAIMHDITGENWQFTTRWRSTFSHLPAVRSDQSNSARYNPLLEVRRRERQDRR